MPRYGTPDMDMPVRNRITARETQGGFEQKFAKSTKEMNKLFEYRGAPVLHRPAALYREIGGCESPAHALPRPQPERPAGVHGSDDHPAAGRENALFGIFAHPPVALRTRRPGRFMRPRASSRS